MKFFYKLLFCLVIGVGCGVSLPNHFFRLWYRSAPIQILIVSFFALLFGMACFFVLNRFIALSVRGKMAAGMIFSLGVALVVMVAARNPIAIELPNPITQHEIRITALGEKNPSSSSDAVEIIEIKVDGQKVKLNSFASNDGWSMSEANSLISQGRAEINYVIEARPDPVITILFNANQNSGMVSYELDNLAITQVDLYQQETGEKVITLPAPVSTTSYATRLLLYACEYIFIGFIIFLFSVLIPLLNWAGYGRGLLDYFQTSRTSASRNIFSVLGILLAVCVLLILAMAQIKTAFSTQYFGPMTNVEEAAYTYTTANNYIKYGLMNSLLLQDFSNSAHPEGHPYVYTHMPAGPDLFMAFLLTVTKGNYQIVRAIMVLLILASMYFYYFFARLILAGLNIKVNAAGYAIALVGPWTLTRLMESQIYPLLPFLAFFPMFALHYYLKTDRKPWLYLFAIVSFLSSLYIEYSLLTGIVFCHMALYLTQLVCFEKKYLWIYLFSITSGIGLHLFQNFLYFGPALFLKEFAILLTNRIAGYPTQEELFNFYHSISVVHHGAHPINIHTLLLQIGASLHVNSGDRTLYLVLLLSVLTALLRRVIPNLNKHLTFGEMISPIPTSVRYFGGMLLLITMTVLSPIIMFPAFAQEVNLAGFGGNFFFSIFITAVVCFSIHQLIQVLVDFYKNCLRVSIRKDHFRASLLTDYFALSFYKTNIDRRRATFVIHRRPYYQWLAGLFFIALLWFNIVYVSKYVSYLGRYTYDYVRLVVDVQQVSPDEIDLDASLADLEQFKGQSFMTNINTATVGFLVRYSGYGVCGPETISATGEIRRDLCHIAFIKTTDHKTLQQEPRYFYYFSYPSLFPGFADCMPSNTMVGARGGDACMALMKQLLSSNFELILENDVLSVFDLQQRISTH